MNAHVGIQHMADLLHVARRAYVVTMPWQALAGKLLWIQMEVTLMLKGVKSKIHSLISATQSD